MATPEYIANSFSQQPDTRNHEMADVLPLVPRQFDGDFLNDVGEPSWVRETMFGDTPNDKDRVRRTGFIELDGHPHLIRVSEPHPGMASGLDVVKHRILLPGWTEAGDCGTAKRLHDAIALANPDHRTITIATDGMSVHGHALEYRKAIVRPFGNMAAARQQIGKRLAGDAPVELIGTSMGSVLALMTALHNIKTAEPHQLNIVGLKFLSPGILASRVPKHEEFRPSLDSTVGRVGTFLKFLGHMSVDGPREGIKHPKEALHAVLGVLTVGAAICKEPDKGTAIFGNLLQLMEGTPWESIKTVAEHYPIHVITGSKDPLREVAQLETLQNLYPGKFTYKVVDGKGHSMTLAAHKTAAALNALAD
jgi:pimeloyl-ACP methyl ester carboxylesterase